jgi:hypothetical protein
MKSGIFIVKDNVGKLLDNLEAMSETQVLVGIPAKEAEREPGTDIDGMNNATLAYIHENGAPEANIPARPFIEPGIQDAKSDISRQFRKAGEAQLDGQAGKAMKHYHLAGEVAAVSIKKKIWSGPFAPLKESTLRARRTRKIAPRTGTKPLIDTAQMLRAVDYVVIAGKSDENE